MYSEILSNMVTGTEIQKWSIWYRLERKCKYERVTFSYWQQNDDQEAEKSFKSATKQTKAKNHYQY